MDNQLIGRLYDAIDDAVNDTVNKAEYNRTIQATIIKCVDATIGKYQCKYQDSSFYAYSEDVNTTYIDGSSVYILVPNNNLNGNKQILGSVKKLGLNYINETEEENFYDINGNSCINSNDKIFGLKSYKKEDNLTLYDKKTGENQIEVNQGAALEYLKPSTSLMIEATIQTKLDKMQQFRGNYGIRFILDFENNSDGATVTKEFCLDVDKLTGNPYKLVSLTRQYAIFDIDYDKFQGINKIEIYSKDFPNHDETKPADIFFSDIKIFGATRMSQSEINGCSINFIFPQGTYFDENNKNIVKQVKAQIKLKGKVVDPVLQNVEFYWYREDLRTTLNSEYYNSWGGRGWKCLNQKTITQPETETEQAVVEWIPMGDTFEIKYASAVASENVFKCVIKYDSRVFNKTFTIKNRNGVFSSKIEASPGQEFYYDVGSPTLTCITSNPDNSDESTDSYLQYNWAVVDNDGLMTFLSETTDINSKLKTAQDELKTIENNIQNGIIFPNAYEGKIEDLKIEITNLEKQQRINGKYLYSIDLTQINQQATFKCSVYSVTDEEGKDDIYLGTSSIIIKNIKDQTQQCRLVINNGNQVFKYTENGIAPTNTSLENPISLKALSYTIYDENGNEVDYDVVRKCASKWKVPISRTMLTGIDSDGQEGAIDSNAEYQYYNNASLLTYKIADKFDYNKDLNNIDITVDYKGIKLYASTNFTFTKQGDIGTNGTDYVCRIKLNTQDEDPPKRCIVTIGSDATTNFAEGKLNYNISGSNNIINTTTAKQLFVAELWKNGEKVEISSENISWKIMKNKYVRAGASSDNKYFNGEDFSYYEIENNNLGTIKINMNYFNYLSYNVSNLIQCQISYNNMNFYDVMPIITFVRANPNYQFDVKENSGYKFALYTSDGYKPTYNNIDPFEIIVKKSINGVMEDISTTKNVDNKLSYKWETYGSVWRKIYNNNRGIWTEEELSSTQKAVINNKDVSINQSFAIPPASYDGECLTHCIWVPIKNNNNDIIAQAHIPLYFLLNKYGIASINQWDGNSVQINEEGGYILSPQIGAGKKDNENRFTGVLMGEVREANRTSSDIGLLGYSNGEKTFFVDAEDGTTILGKKSSGRMVIDPASNKALIYSDNFWTGYTEKGKPSSYASTNEKGEGMLIDLTTPEVRFGSGNFKVDSSGSLTAKEGKIADFTITVGETGTTADKNQKVKAGKIYSGQKNDWYKSGDGIYLDSVGRIYLGNNFWVDETGKLGARSGKIAAFNFDDKLFYSDGKLTNKGKLDENAGGIYIDSSISGKGTTKKLMLGSKFYVTEDGTLTAKAGTLGSFTLTVDALYSNDKSTWNNNDNGIFISKSGQLKIGGQTNGVNKFSVDSNGALTCAGGTVGGWKISNSSISAGSTTLSSTGAITTGNFSVSNTGAISSTSGTIGGWTINDGYLSKGNLQLGKDGSIKSTTNNWSINANGSAHFYDVSLSKPSISNGGTLSGTLSGGSYTGGVSGASSGYGTNSVLGALNSLSGDITSVKNLMSNGINTKSIAVANMTYSNGGITIYGNMYFGGSRVNWKTKTVDGKTINYLGKD